jgi:2-methylisocitrate lyase-like PEP mutase family enzyme
MSATETAVMPSRADRLRQLLRQPGLLLMPCAWDALSARLIERAGFKLTMMSGFAVSGARLAMPDTGLISFAEMCDQLRCICNAVSDLLVIGDGDTGYGNPLNVQRTVREYAAAGAACIMIEDQVSPKRCGHTRGKQVVGFDEARMRSRAAVDAARAAPGGILVMARTDARATDGFDEAMRRCRMFEEEGADILFLEAPVSEDEMRAFASSFRTPTMANLVAGGQTPMLDPARLEAMGFRIAAYPVTAFCAAIEGTLRALQAIREGRPNDVPQIDFATLKSLVGFDAYYAAESKYRS